MITKFIDKYKMDTTVQSQLVSFLREILAEARFFHELDGSPRVKMKHIRVALLMRGHVSLT